MAEAVLVYDDDCGFCTWWAAYLDARTDLRVVGFEALDDELRASLPPDHTACSHVVTDEGVHSCGASIEEALLHTRLGAYARPVVERLRRVSPYRGLREWCYRRGANNRDLLGNVLWRAPPARRDEGTGEDAE
ncbi:MAG: DCC1-like thiol-disulfide oxidoreductase family protein [Halobacteriota archaeon]